ncbi:MAG: hypothetical protein V1887_02190 [Candidatus Aenigmatarchaeota archaeon]
MQAVRLFGLLEHIGFYGIAVFTVMAIGSSDFLFAYLALACWLLSFLSHVMESRIERKGARKILVGI